MSDDVRHAMANGAPTVVLHVGGVPIDLQRVAPGGFVMGSPQDEEGHAENEAPARHVCVSRPFYLGRHEVTRAQYAVVMGGTRGSAEDDALPVSQITYAAALDFCVRLSRATHLDVHLPTEAQWEYACRAGTRSCYCSGPEESDLDRVGWYDGNSQGRVHPVGQKQPNAWGLYDMHGNVWEYCADFIDDYATMAVTDPHGPAAARRGAMRGGGWIHGAEYSRAATRLISDDMFGGAGLRIAMSAD
ncbi:MAG: formylglycine-generating enzyme family protein [Dokdonella sp.]